MVSDGGNSTSLTLPASIAQLQGVNKFIDEELDRCQCPLRTRTQLFIAIEELFVNVAHYAYPEATPDKPGMAWISCSYSENPSEFIVEIVDEGIPYNPLEKPDAVTPDNIMDVPIGGLGILMAKRSVDEIKYERTDNKNIVQIIKRW